MDVVQNVKLKLDWSFLNEYKKSKL